MDIRGITFDQMQSIVRNVSAEYYGGNIILHPDAKPLGKSGFRGRIVTRTSTGSGARRSWSGRRGRWACWHAYRDVMMEVFETSPDAVIVTALATYRGQAGFLTDYPATAYKNIGSQMSPAYMPELCDCFDD